jgi:hypothetical protein
MSVKLDDMKTRTKKLVVEWDGEQVDVSYYPNVVTPQLLEQVAEAAAQEDLSVLGVMLEPVLEWWDVLDDKGKRIPTSAAVIRTIPMSFLNAVQTAIEEAQRPPEGSPSPAG